MKNAMMFLLYPAGAYTLFLGSVHFFLPYLLDFDKAIPIEGEKLKVFRLLGYTYGTTRRDVRGIAWVMNHAVSYTLVSIGVIDLIWTQWVSLHFSRFIFFWIGGWWLIRAFSQLYLGSRRGDIVLVVWFASLGVIHLIIGLL
jgi:hypothetical protein